LNYSPNPQVSPDLTPVRCLYLVALHHGIQVTPEQLGRIDTTDPIGSVLRLMREVGLAGSLVRKKTWNNLINLGSAFPVMAESPGGSWMIVASVIKSGDGTVVVAVLDPKTEQQGIQLYTEEKFEEIWSGRLILAKRKYRLDEEKQPFGLRWFLPDVLREGRYLRDVALAAIMSTLIGFATPLFFQIMIDKVIPHKSYHTLFAVVIAVIVTVVFDSVFGYVRQYLMLFATNKIDARLASRTFSHMLRLPMQFFETHPAGVLLRHMQQTDAIRSFLTGRLFQTALDTFALPVLIVGLCFYSGVLTAVVLVFALIIAGIIGFMVPTFRIYLQQLYGAEGARQADLVETLHGMRAVKSLALEPLRIKSWDNKVTASIRRRATVGYFSAIAMVLVGGLQNLLQITILGIGAKEVFDGTITIGALVAFNMLSGRVISPLVSMVGLINEYQQTALSVRMLGTVMNHPPERDPNQHGIRPNISGNLEFHEVSFTYDGAATPALDHVSFKVEKGQMIGIVGRSGSGKTTVTRLIQGIHAPRDGLIKLDGTDIRHIDLTHLRRSIGVVLQENILFRGTVRDNIAAAKPDATLEEVMEVSRLAGADEFIERLPMSYETYVEESANNFSGGQRQRLAIARALLLRPSLLLFDEATSALDPESEAIVQTNLAEIGRGRTMIIVSHRLSSLVNADAILVLDRGKVIDLAPHETLLQRCDVYRHLWQQQTRHIQS
jgi:ATP-binding cassette subfamily B protein